MTSDELDTKIKHYISVLGKKRVIEVLEAFYFTNQQSYDKSKLGSEEEQLDMFGEQNVRKD